MSPAIRFSIITSLDFSAEQCVAAGNHKKTNCYSNIYQITHGNILLISSVCNTNTGQGAARITFSTVFCRPSQPASFRWR